MQYPPGTARFRLFIAACNSSFFLRGILAFCSVLFLAAVTRATYGTAVTRFDVIALLVPKLQEAGGLLCFVELSLSLFMCFPVFCSLCPCTMKKENK
jgi:hypothetical protein